MERTRAWRRHRREVVIATRVRFVKRYGMDLWRVPGYFDDRKPLDCGKTQCGLCHPSKRWYRKERREAKRELAEDR